jgi:hypothetical protein
MGRIEARATSCTAAARRARLGLDTPGTVLRTQGHRLPARSSTLRPPRKGGMCQIDLTHWGPSPAREPGKSIFSKYGTFGGAYSASRA